MSESKKKQQKPKGNPTKVTGERWPKPKHGALQGIRFALTGCLDTITSKDMEELIKGSGGIFSSKVSNLVNYLIVGELKVGATHGLKVDKAKEFGAAQVTEEQFFTYIVEMLDNHDENAESIPEVPSEKAIDSKAIKKDGGAKAKKTIKAKPLDAGDHDDDIDEASSLQQSFANSRVRKIKHDEDSGDSETNEDALVAKKSKTESDDISDDDDSDVVEKLIKKPPVKKAKSGKKGSGSSKPKKKPVKTT